MATDASKCGLGVSRTSSLNAQGRVALQELRQATPSCSGSVEWSSSQEWMPHVKQWSIVACSRRFMSQWRERPQPSVSSRPIPVEHLVDQVADFSHATLPQIVEKNAPHVRIWIVEASLPSNLLTAYREISRLVSLLQQLVPDAQVACVAECALNIGVGIWDRISRALNVKPIEVCPSSRCPIRRPRLY